MLNRLPGPARRQPAALAGLPESSFGPPSPTGPTRHLRNFLQAGTGAVTRTWQDKMREVEVSVDDFGAVGDADNGGTTGTNDTAAFQAAVDYLNGIGGGIVTFSRKRYLIDGNLTLKANVTIRGPIEMPGHIQPVGTASYDDLVGVLYVNSAATITTQWSCGVQNGYIIRKGLVLPFADATAATAGVAAFAGTPITVSHHDARLSNLLILGFEYPFESTPAASRLRIDYVSYDCTNGPKYDEVRDVMHVQFCHGFPYTTTSQSWVTDTLLTRTGTGMDFRTANDIGMVTNAFTFGYGIGFEIAAGNILTVLGCSADYASGLSSTSVGFRISNDALDTVLVGCSAAAQGTGVVSDPGGATTVAGSYTKVIGFTGLDNDIAHVNIGTGRALVTASSMRGGAIGVFVGASAGRCVLTDLEFDGVTTPLSIDAAVLPLCDIDGNVYNSCTETVAPQRVSILQRRFINNADTASAGIVSFEGDSATPATLDAAFNSYRLSNASGTQKEAIRQTWVWSDATNASEDAQTFWSVMIAGTLTDKLLLTGTAISPTANDGLTCGSSGLRFSAVHATNGTIQTSDPRLKKDIAPVPAGALSIVNDVSPITFRWKAGPDDRTHWGFRAGDIKAAVDKTGVDCAAYVKCEDGVESLSATELIPILWKAAQELSAEVERVKASRA